MLPQVAFKCGICFMSCQWLAACMMIGRGLELVTQVMGSIGLSDSCMHSLEHVTKTTTTTTTTTTSFHPSVAVVCNHLHNLNNRDPELDDVQP